MAIEKLEGEEPLRKWKTPEEQVAEIEERKRAGKFTAADEIRLDELRGQIEKISKRASKGGLAEEAEKIRREREMRENQNLGNYL